MNQGTMRVGVQTDTLPLPRRVQLAVVAHIRHMYTGYDKLLKEVPWQAARSLVEKQTLTKLAEWRGEDEGDSNAIEEILREVIVISDDEDDNDGGNDEQSQSSDTRRFSRLYGRDSVEVVTRDTAPQAVQLQTIDFSRREDERHVATPVIEDEARYSFIGQGQYSIAARDPERIQRDEARRLQVWQEARNLTRHRPIDRQDVVMRGQSPPPRGSRYQQPHSRDLDLRFIQTTSGPQAPKAQGSGIIYSRHADHPKEPQDSRPQVSFEQGRRSTLSSYLAPTLASLLI